jgi:S-adenosylmethionine hydrolase
MLSRFIDYANDSIILAIVDPTVGSDRNAIAAEITLNKKTFKLIGPANGIFSEVVLKSVVKKIAVLDKNKFVKYCPGLKEKKRGKTFDGRDVFAPAAASLLNGFDIWDLGEKADKTIIGKLKPIGKFKGESCGAISYITWIDRFGNIELNATLKELKSAVKNPKQILIDKKSYKAKIYHCFSDIEKDTFGLIEDSYGYIAIAKYLESAAHILRVCVGDKVVIK